MNEGVHEDMLKKIGANFFFISKKKKKKKMKKRKEDKISKSNEETHPLNIYKSPPNFGELSIEFPSFQK